MIRDPEHSRRLAEYEANLREDWQRSERGKSSLPIGQAVAGVAILTLAVIGLYHFCIWMTR